MDPWDWPETWSKIVKNEKFFKFRTNILLGSLKYAKNEKNYKKNPSSFLWPVVSFDWPKTWCKKVKNKKIYKLST